MLMFPWTWVILGEMTDRINLDSMHDRHRALTEAIAGTYREAASVCLSRHHKAPVVITVSDDGTESEAEVVWITPDSKTLGAWANTTDATEAGAYGFVIAGLEYIRGLFAVRRAETGTGADYYVGPYGSGEEDLEACLRLEVSGVDGGNREVVAARLGAKVRQAQRGASNLPALAGVIGFSAKLLMVRNVPEEM
jgi:hypothetical protein